MIDLAKIQYRVVVMDESKNQYNIKEYIENLGWEENDGELSVRTSFVAKNDKTSKGYLSKIIKPGCLVGVFATDGASQDEEVARGYVTSASAGPAASAARSSRSRACTAPHSPGSAAGGSSPCGRRSCGSTRATAGCGSRGTRRIGCSRSSSRTLRLTHRHLTHRSGRQCR